MPNTGNSNSVVLVQDRCFFCGIPAESYPWISVILTILTGVLLLCFELGVLVFFALPASMLLTIFIAVIMAVSVFLIGIALYQIISRSFKRVNELESFEAKKTALETEIASVKAQLEEVLSSAGLERLQEEIKAKEEEILERERELSSLLKRLELQEYRFSFLKEQLYRAKQEAGWVSQNIELAEEIERKKQLLEAREKAHFEEMSALELLISTRK